MEFSLQCIFDWKSRKNIVAPWPIPVSSLCANSKGEVASVVAFFIEK
jgi:hypothetical protein